MNDVARMFADYKLSAYGPDPLPEDQLREIKRAFYAGMYGGLTTQDDDLASGVRECEEFKDRVLRGTA